MIRRNTEDMSRTEERGLAVKASEEDRERLIHELRVHQMELEMQNRELREAQEQLEEATSRYSDLYEFAPVQRRHGGQRSTAR